MINKKGLCIVLSILVEEEVLWIDLIEEEDTTLDIWCSIDENILSLNIFKSQHQGVAVMN